MIDAEAKLILREVNKKLKNVRIKQIEEEQGSGVDFQDPDSAQIVKDSLGKDFKIYSIDDPKEYHNNPKDPYKTSTLQQDAINKLG
jgi:DNA topoisomerase-1